MFIIIKDLKESFKETTYTKMAGGLGGVKKGLINFMLDKPVAVYLGGATVLHLHRWYNTRTTYNYWFGKIDFERRLERNQL